MAKKLCRGSLHNYKEKYGRSFEARNLRRMMQFADEKFILEFGKGFAFVERQKRMIIDGEDHHLDLLFYNRYLRRLVVVELKLGHFEATYSGQMKLYLKWLNRYEQQEYENEPIGLMSRGTFLDRKSP